MLFNSYEFLFFFLPTTLIGFFLIGKKGHHRIAISWLVGASLFFYGWWNPAYLSLISVSILFNYSVGIFLSGKNRLLQKKIILTLAVIANLSLLGYFKYANFFIDNLNIVANTDFNIKNVILPLAISFFTFQQITYLIDAFRGETKEYNFLHYCLFVTFFPQLIAGPIVHHREMLPQFVQDTIYKLNYQHLAVGTTIFILGLFKKVVLADNAALYATPVFNLAETGVAISLVEAWVGSFAYTFQLYFDFSGYSDMAIGIARMFGVRLPLNFNSPYKATNIIDFWRRWHITLSRFLRDYLYIPLGGSRKGPVRRQANILITMLLGGLWHGAGWNFILWGALHGFYLMINHAWRKIFPTNKLGLFSVIFSWFITFIAVVFAWVPFRAVNMDATINIWKGMTGLQGISLDKSLELKLGSASNWLNEYGIMFDGFFRSDIKIDSILWLFILLVISVFFPNTQQLMRRYRPAFETYRGEIKKLRWSFMEWSPSIATLLITLSALFYSLASMSSISEFLYFNF